MKQLLVIGAGINQVPIIETAKNMGCYVHVVTPQGDFPGIAIADEWFEEDIFNKDAIVEYGRLKNVDGVLSDQSDMAAPIVAYVAEKLGLPTYGYKNALYFTDKALMRTLFKELGFAVPQYEKVKTYEEAIYNAKIIGYPVVIKPTNSFSSRGITMVKNNEGMETAYKKAFDASQLHEVIVEKYIKGRQFFSQGFVSKAKLNMFAYSDRYYYDLPDVFIPYTNIFPAKIDISLKNRMNDMFDKIINYLKPSFGHVWAEWILDDKTDELYIVEMAIRGAGAHVTTEIIPKAYGIDTQAYLVNAALGKTEDFSNFNKFDHKSAAFFSFLLPKGKIVSISGLEELKKLTGVSTTYLKEMKVGDLTWDIVDKNSRYGLIIVHGESRDDLDKTWENIKNLVNIQVNTSKGIKGIIWE